MNPIEAAVRMRKIIKEERNASVNRLWFGWVVERDRLWEQQVAFTPVDGGQEAGDYAFESFEEWLDYVCQDESLGISDFSTIKSLTTSFATGFAPWLVNNEVYDSTGETRVTPEYFIQRMGYGKYGDVNTAWWPKHKAVKYAQVQVEMALLSPGLDETVQAAEAFKEAVLERNEVMVECATLVINPFVTRASLDIILKDKGWRKARRTEPQLASWPWTVLDKDDNRTVIIEIKKTELATIKDALYMYLQPEQSKPKGFLARLLSKVAGDGS